MRGTWPSMLACASPTSNNNPLGTGFGPARADCGFREPLAPRLARPGNAMVPGRFAATLRRLGAHSSAGERPLHTREVPGSIPGAPITARVARRIWLIQEVHACRVCQKSAPGADPGADPRAAALTGARHALFAVTAQRLDRPETDPAECRSRIVSVWSLAEPVRPQRRRR
jgi:hypothetical protein